MIIGWGHKYKYICNVFKTPCFKCDYIVNWRLYEIESYYHIFWIPVFTYKSKWIIRCPACSQEYPRDSIQRDWLERRSELFESLENNKITRGEYERKLERLREKERVEAENQGVPTEEEVRDLIEGVDE